jgi:hypothetical protein
MKKSVVGIVATKAQAQRIVDELQTIGVSTSEVSALFPDKDGERDFAHENHTKAPEGAIAGVGAGGLLGGTLGLLAGIGAVAIPGVGPLIAAGPLLGALSGAATGAAVGGIAGALIGLGIPELEAKAYEGKIRDGNVLLAVHAETSDIEKKIKDIFKRNNAQDVHATSEASVPKAANG